MARTNSHVSSGKSSKKKIIFTICAITTALAVVICAYMLIRRNNDYQRLQQQKEMLSEIVSETLAPEATEPPQAELPEVTPEVDLSTIPVQYQPTQEASALLEINPYYVGWLQIDDTLIDYPVVQTMEDETMYLDLDFYGMKNSNGTLIMDTDSEVGVGTADLFYIDGVWPGTNLIIHGHTMKSGEMFGNLTYYESEEYGKSHNIINFDTIYEHREYELIAAFYTQIYYPEDDVFKFYEFFQADTQEEFDDWYNNIKELSLYDTGVEASFGDEFITLSCCSYQVEDGRFVVIGRRTNGLGNITVTPAE